MDISNLPVIQDENFIAENHVMDFGEIRDKQFIVAVSTGDRNKHKFLTSTVHGPYNFVEMVEEVGTMWIEYQHHAKVTILEKDRKKVPKILDENTIDYIECHYADIITDEMLGGAFDKQYTCKAGLESVDQSEAPKPVQTPLPAPASINEEDNN